MCLEAATTYPAAPEYLRQMREVLSGNAREQPSLRKIAARADWESIIKAVERFKCEKWAEFQNRYGDWGRDLALYLGRKRCQLKLRKLGELAGGMDYASVAAAVTRFDTRLRRDTVLASAVVKLQAALMEAHE